MIEQFKKEVDAGLSVGVKSLPSKFFYDKKGDALFVDIMHLPEYYVTRAELEIFQTQTQQIIDNLQLNPDVYFELIELGPGDGSKTRELLQSLDSQNYKFDYLPIDISQNAIDQLEENINREMPNVSVKTKQGDYFEILESLKEETCLKIVLFLGSNIGNMDDEIASEFIYRLGSNIHPGGKLLLGVDLIKSSTIVLPAYNDNRGVTAAFNLNLLHRINNELHANFDVDNFEHQPEYCEIEGVAKSYLTSTMDQKVRIEKIGKTYHFIKGEKILTEISRKYNDVIINKIIADTDFIISNKLSDSKKYFTNYILERT